MLERILKLFNDIKPTHHSDGSTIEGRKLREGITINKGGLAIPFVPLEIIWMLVEWCARNRR